MPRGLMGRRCSYDGGAGRSADEDKHLRNDDVRGPGVGSTGAVMHARDVRSTPFSSAFGATRLLI